MQMKSQTTATANEPSTEEPTEYSREQQMALMLDLFSAQMDAALQEADESVEKLTRAFSGLIDHTKTVDGQNAAEIGQHTRDAVMAIQFYDRLSQRLGHVRYSLSTMAMFICSQNASAQSDRWNRLRNSLRKLYSSEEERALFELMLSGASAEEARERASDRNRAAMANNVELF